MYEVIIRQPAQHFIKSLGVEEQKKILNSIQLLEVNPLTGKELRGRLSGLRSLRIDSKHSTYRVIYKVEHTQLIVLVLQTDYRENIYSKKMGK